MPEPQIPSARTRVIREAERGVYDRETVYRILDEGFLCHAGFVVDGQPFVIPTSYGRKDSSLYIHGSAASRMLRQMKDGVPVCITVTLLEGLVLARSIFNHSMNYRSVVILGKATLVDDPEEKLAALRILSEHILPGDDEEDYSFPTWAGVVPLEMVAGAPIADARLLPGTKIPQYARHYARK